MWPTILNYNWSIKINISLSSDQLVLSCYHKIQQSEVHHMAIKSIKKRTRLPQTAALYSVWQTYSPQRQILHANVYHETQRGCNQSRFLWRTPYIGDTTYILEVLATTRNFLRHKCCSSTGWLRHSVRLGYILHVKMRNSFWRARRSFCSLYAIIKI